VKRVVRMAAIFTIFEIVISAFSGFVAKQWPQTRGKLLYVDYVLYAIFGALLAVRGHTRFVIVIATAACVGTVDAMIGGPLGILFGPPQRGRTPLVFILTLNQIVYPTLVVLAAAVGAGAAWPFRRIDNPPPSA